MADRPDHVETSSPLPRRCGDHRDSRHNHTPGRIANRHQQGRCTRDNSWNQCNEKYLRIHENEPAVGVEYSKLIDVTHLYVAIDACRADVTFPFNFAMVYMSDAFWYNPAAQLLESLASVQSLNQCEEQLNAFLHQLR